MRLFVPPVLLLAALALPAAAQDPKSAGPALEVRVRSLNDLLDRAEYLAGLADKEDAAKQFRGVVAAFSNDKEGLEGLDPARPFGLVAEMTANVADSPTVLMIPVADETRFLRTLKERLELAPEKGADGAYKLTVPKVNEPVHLRFADGYLFVAARPASLDPAARPVPKAFFDAVDHSVASVRVRLDRIPDDLKAVVLGQVELKLADARKAEAEGSLAERKLKALIHDGILSTFKSLADDGKELAFRFAVDPKSDELSAELTLSAKEGSPLAAAFKRAGSRTSRPAAVAAREGAVVRAAVSLEIPTNYARRYEAVVDEVLKEALDKTDENSRPAVKRVMDAVAPTLRAGILDAAFSLAEGREKGQYAASAAVRVFEGKKLEQLLKDFAAFVPGAVAAVTFDKETVAGFAVHSVDLKVADEEFVRRFGSRALWLATSAETFAAGIGSQGVPSKDALGAKPANPPLVGIEVDVARLLPLAEKGLEPARVQEAIKEVFGDGPLGERDSVGLAVEAGDKLTLRLTAKGKAVRLAVKLEELKKR